MDFWHMSVDDALSGIPASIPIAEKTLIRFASKDLTDPLDVLPHSDGKSQQIPEEIDASQTVNGADDTKRRPVSKKKSQPQDEEMDSAVSLKKAYFEVKKFAISGMEGAEKEEAKVRLALSLGAKPKKKCVNYKELKKDRSEAKKAAAEERLLKVRKSGIKKKKTKKTGKKSKKAARKK